MTASTLNATEADVRPRDLHRDRPHHGFDDQPLPERSSPKPLSPQNPPLLREDVKPPSHAPAVTQLKPITPRVVQAPAAAAPEAPPSDDDSSDVSSTNSDAEGDIRTDPDPGEEMTRSWTRSRMQGR